MPNLTAGDVNVGGPEFSAGTGGSFGRGTASLRDLATKPFRSPPPVILPPGSDAAPQTNPVVGVNVAGIAEGRERVLPLPVATPREDAGQCAPPPAPRCEGQPSKDPAAPLPGQAGLRLMPLAGFSWGRMTGQPVPRTRGDHALILLRAGQIRLNFPGHGRSDTDGALYFLPAGTAFAAMPGPNVQGEVLLISRDLARDLSPALPKGTLIADTGADLLHLTHLLHDLDSFGASPRPMRDQALHCQLGLLAVLLGDLQPLRRSAPATTGSPAKIADPVLIERFLYLVADRLGDGDTLSDLAAALGCSLAVLDRASIAVRENGQSIWSINCAMTAPRPCCATRNLRPTSSRNGWAMPALPILPAPL